MYTVEQHYGNWIACDVMNIGMLVFKIPICDLLSSDSPPLFCAFKILPQVTYYFYVHIRVLLSYHRCLNEAH